MAPRSGRASGHDTDTSMAEDSEPIRQLPVDPMVRLTSLGQLFEIFPGLFLVYFAFFEKQDIDYSS
jgi:hypothetical protein